MLTLFYWIYWIATQYNTYKTFACIYSLICVALLIKRFKANLMVDEHLFLNAHKYSRHNSCVNRLHFSLCHLERKGKRNVTMDEKLPVWKHYFYIVLYYFLCESWHHFLWFKLCCLFMFSYTIAMKIISTCYFRSPDVEGCFYSFSLHEMREMVQLPNVQNLLLTMKHKKHFKIASVRRLGKWYC